MAEPISTTAALIATAASAGNAYATGKQNKKSRQFSRETYAKTKADNIAFWNMQNEYNSPEKQMERLKNAGLNPNMLYDKTGAVIPAQNINTPDVQGGQFRTPDFGSVGQTILQGYFDTRIKQAQYDNMKEQNRNIFQDTLLKAQQTEEAGARAQGYARDNAVKYETFTDEVRAASLRNMKLEADISYTLDENARKAAMAAPNLQTAIINAARADKGLQMDDQQIEKLKQEVYNSKQEGKIKAVQAAFAENGINFNDTLVMRWIADYIQGFSQELTGIKGVNAEGRIDAQNLKNLYKYFKK